MNIKEAAVKIISVVPCIHLEKQPHLTLKHCGLMALLLVILFYIPQSYDFFFFYSGDLLRFRKQNTA